MAAVVDDPGEAARLAAVGHDVVVVIAEGSPAPAVEGPGRVAVFVGHLGDPAAQAGAVTMAEELFGGGRPALPAR